MEATSAGAGRVALRVHGGDRLTDAAELPIVVETPVAMETAALTGVVPLRPGAPAARVDEALGSLDGVRGDTGSLEISLSSSPLAGLGAGLDQLATYPYGCTEQTVSRLVPLLPLRDLSRALGVPRPRGDS